MFLDGSLAYAAELGVPIWSAQEWLQFTEERHGSNFTNMSWDPTASRLTLSLTPSNGAESTLTALIPAAHAGRKLESLTVNGVTTPTNHRLVLGNVEYALVVVPAQEQVFKASYA